MARPAFDAEEDELVNPTNEYGGGKSPAIEVGPRPGELFPDDNGQIAPQPGSTERPREVPGPGRDVPTKPLDVNPRSPQPSTTGAGSPSDGASYTPTRPKAPAPVAAQPPAPFSPMAPLMDPGAMSVAMRAPFTPEPTSQYGGAPGAGGLLGSQEGLLGGGLGMGGGDDFQQQ